MPAPPAPSQLHLPQNQPLTTNSPLENHALPVLYFSAKVAWLALAQLWESQRYNLAGVWSGDCADFHLLSFFILTYPDFTWGQRFMSHRGKTQGCLEEGVRGGEGCLWRVEYRTTKGYDI